jgi:hypothetical protein
MHLPFHMSVGYRFESAMIHCDNLIKLERRAQGGGRGSALAWETSANRAVIVLAIASWQAFVQDTVIFILDRRMPKSAHPPAVLRELDRFSTPSAKNTRKLLRLVGFDPDPYWTWDRTKIRQVEGRLQDWLAVRHAIAHGDVMPEVAVLEAVRENRLSFGLDGPSVRVEDARQCIAFIRKLAWATLNGVAWEM